MTPTYTYRCPDCTTEVTEVRPMSESSEAPECECGETMRVRITNTNRPRVEGGTRRFHR